MPTEEDVVAGVLGQLSAVRGTGEGAEGLVRVELDGTSAMLDLVIEPKAMRLPSEDLAAAIREAFDAARKGVQDHLSTAQAPAYEFDEHELNATLNDISFDAERRLGEMMSITEDLITRVDRIDRNGAP